MMGTYREIEIKVTYADRITVFIPDGENARELIDAAVDDRIGTLPSEIDGFEYEEETFKEVM